MFSSGLHIPREAQLLQSRTLEVSEQSWGLTQPGCKGRAT